MPAIPYTQQVEEENQGPRLVQAKLKSYLKNKLKEWGWVSGDRDLEFNSQYHKMGGYLFLIFIFFIVVLGGGTLWHLQKFL
jgi:hypothetical protein